VIRIPYFVSVPLSSPGSKWEGEQPILACDGDRDWPYISGPIFSAAVEIYKMQTTFWMVGYWL
jgi:hypothetical protein